ncbi:hypothetical protein [Roseibium sp.]|uniref:hypothetical protein n=1 Tax=Roseibium sp. TaxID=1936156 RepID=UPI003BA93A54
MAVTTSLVVIPDKCSASCAPIRKPDVFRAEGAASFGGIDKSVCFAHADFWIPDQAGHRFQISVRHRLTCLE